MGPSLCPVKNLPSDPKVRAGLSIPPLEFPVTFSSLNFHVNHHGLQGNLWKWVSRGLWADVGQTSGASCLWVEFPRLLLSLSPSTPPSFLQAHCMRMCMCPHLHTLFLFSIIRESPNVLVTSKISREVWLVPLELLSPDPSFSGCTRHRSWSLVNAIRCGALEKSPESCHILQNCPPNTKEKRVRWVPALGPPKRWGPMSGESRDA